MQLFDTALTKGILLALSVSGITVGGGAIITASRDNAVQDQRLQVLESRLDKLSLLGDKLEGLDHQLADANKNIAVLSQQLQDAEKHSVPRK